MSRRTPMGRCRSVPRRCDASLGNRGYEIVCGVSIRVRQGDVLVSVVHAAERPSPLGHGNNGRRGRRVG
eukprot:734007-Hanusia_phi.AAC.1